MGRRIFLIEWFERLPLIAGALILDAVSTATLLGPARGLDAAGPALLCSIAIGTAALAMRSAAVDAFG